MVWNRQLTIGLRTGVHQKQEQSLLVRENRDRGSHFHLGLGWRDHCKIKNYDSDLRFQKSTQDNISHGSQRETTLISRSKNQTRRVQSHSWPRTLHGNNAWAGSHGSMQTLKNSSWFEFDWLDQFCIWPKRRRHISCSQSTFCPDTWMHLPIKTGSLANGKRLLRYLSGSNI